MGPPRTQNTSKNMTKSNRRFLRFPFWTLEPHSPSSHPLRFFLCFVSLFLFPRPHFLVVYLSHPLYLTIFLAHFSSSSTLCRETRLERANSWSVSPRRMVKVRLLRVLMCCKSEGGRVSSFWTNYCHSLFHSLRGNVDAYVDPS